MDLTISHSCPSCGGPVEMDEADRVTICPYCDVQNYMVVAGMLRYVLPDRIPSHVDRRSIIYFPYLRFKGNIYTCIGRKVGCKVLDTTHQGLDVRLLPPSLGLRPQAMKLVMVSDTMEGRFVKRSAPPAVVLERAEKLARSVLDSVEDVLYHRAFIGETVSLLYMPLYVENGRVFDGTLNRELGTVEDWPIDETSLISYKKRWQPSFLAMICPGCGDTIRGEPDSLVVNCFNCDSCWSEEKGRFRRVAFRLLEAKGKSVYLPFWRIAVAAKGLEMNTFADLLKVTNQPVVVRQAHRRKPLEFWVPAMKIRPRIFLTMAKSATLSQLKYSEGEQKLAKNLRPVTLPLKEGVQAVKSVFAETSVNRKEMMPQLSDLSLSVKNAVLTYLPFKDTGHDYVQHHSALSVAASVVRLGRRL